MIQIFHHNDMDGYAAAAVLVNADPDMITNCTVCDYNQHKVTVDFDTKGEEVDGVYIVDLSFTNIEDFKVVLDIINKYDCPVTWIDHHTSSVHFKDEFIETDLCKKLVSDKKLNMYIGEGACGAVLTYEYIHADDSVTFMPDILKYIDDYDRWVYSYGDKTKHIHLGLQSMKDYSDPYSYTWKRLLRDNDKDLFYSILSSGEIIYDYMINELLSYRDRYMYVKEFEGIEAAVINRKSNSWIFGDAYDKYPLVIVWVYDGKGYSYSLYANPKYDTNCAKIAEKYGGGGHIGAAGFYTNTQVV